MYKFKVSKFKNAAPKSLKREEYCSDIPVGNLMLSSSNYVASSCKWIAFNVELGGSGKVGVIGLNEAGRKDASMPVIHAHAEFVSDLAFSPFHDDLLATTSSDGMVKLWRIPSEGLTETLSVPVLSSTSIEKKIDTLRFHPTADNIMSISSGDTVHILEAGSAFDVRFSVSSGSGKVIQSCDWKADGRFLVTSSKDKQLRIIDPRESSIVQETSGHDGIKDSRTKWLGESDCVISTGFGMGRDRVLGLWDTRSFTKPITTLSVDSSNGILMPFFDADTNMLFLAGKGDSVVSFYEYSDSAPYFTLASQHGLEHQTLGMDLVSKRGLDVMCGEVNRLLQLAKNALVPLKYIVPRKSYRDFHADLFPDTSSGIPSMAAQEWLNGANNPMTKVSLNPGVKAKAEVPKVQKMEHDKPVPVKETPKKEKIPDNSNADRPVLQSSKQDDVPSKVQAANSSQVFSAVRSSKFRHLHADQLHRKNNIDNVRNLSESLSGESDGFQGHHDLLAIPIAGPGGQIAVFQLSKPGRLPDVGLPVLVNGSSLLDFVMDPFNEHIIAAGCEDGSIRIWQIPEDGLKESLTEPAEKLTGHESKVNILRYHPTAANLLTSSSFDFTVRLWNVANGKEILKFSVPDQVFSLAWSPDGARLAVFTKDGSIRVYDPRHTLEPIQEGKGPEGLRGGRLVWGGPDNKWIIASGFSRNTLRSVSVYDSENLAERLGIVELDASPSTLSLHYDEDSSTLFATGKGDSTIFAFEISEEPPHIFELSHCQLPDLHQGISFLRKDLCNVAQVEFARAARLMKTTIETLSFVVPRVRREYFQDDLFPETRMTWQAALTCKEWLRGRNDIQGKLDLKPADMIALSNAPVEAPKAKKYESHKELEAFKSTEQKKEELISSMITKMGDVDEEPLFQDTMEGVDDDEWDD